MNEKIAVRDAVAADTEEICTIYNAALAERGSTFETAPRSPADFDGRIDDVRFPLLVSVADKDILGWAGPRPLQRPPVLCRDRRGEHLCRPPGHEGGTLARPSPKRSPPQPRKRGFHKLIGKLFTDNVASIRLVERCGFDSVGLHQCHGQLDGIWRDVLVVERQLGST